MAQCPHNITLLGDLFLLSIDWRISCKQLMSILRLLVLVAVVYVQRLPQQKQNPNLKIALVSKVYPMRSHTVAAEGGAAAVIKEEDSYDKHFQDTVAGGDWLCEQDVVEYFVQHSPVEMTQLERWGCPWSRKADGDVNVRRFRWNEN